jgi:hypothetical protein
MGGAKGEECTASLRPTKLFIGGITRNTTTKQLRDHFSRFGRVLDCVAMRQPDGRPRGFGYVTLDSSKAAESCLAAPQVIDGRVVDLKRAVPEGDMENAPTTRLHTPGVSSPNAQSPEQALLSTPGPLSPTANASPLGVIPRSWLATAPPSLNSPWPAAWGGNRGAPDCVELLSTGRSLHLDAASLAAAHVAASAAAAAAVAAKWMIPETPTAMSAEAPEFVPQVHANQLSPMLFTPQPGLQNEGFPLSATKGEGPKRTALGEITNMVKAKGDVAKVTMADCKDLENMDEHLQMLKKRVPASLIELDTDAIFEDPEPRSPPGLEKPASLPDHTCQNDLPSLGSVDHAAGNCKRCNFFAKGRCQNGSNCTFCHLAHDKRKPSRQEKRDQKVELFAGFDASRSEEDLDDLEFDDVQQIMAFSMLPGMPAIATAKLPTPLALPGAVYPCFGSSSPMTVMPPPGLTLPRTWQPDEEVSPAQASEAFARPLLSTVPSRSSYGFSDPASLVFSASPFSQSMMPLKVTIGTQTSEDEGSLLLSSHA